MTIGTLENAKVAASFGRRRGDGEMPKGWEYISSGSTRCAYLGPDGVVYKVGRSRINNAEHENMVSCRAMPEHEYLRFPLTAVFDVGSNDRFGEPLNVLAMEYVPDTTHENLLPANVLSETFDVYGLSDMFYANWRVHEADGKVLVTIIDAGEC